VAPAGALAEAPADTGEEAGAPVRLVGAGAIEAPASTATMTQKATLSFVMPLYLVITRSSPNPNG
jgi:hypothetical protein